MATTANSKFANSVSSNERGNGKRNLMRCAWLQNTGRLELNVLSPVRTDRCLVSSAVGVNDLALQSGGFES